MRIDCLNRSGHSEGLVINKIQKGLFYFKREGFWYLLKKAGFFEESANKRLYKYYEKLPLSLYEKELKDQIRLFFPDAKKYDIKSPSGFNEWIQYLKVCMTEEELALKTRLSDKYAVREWIANKIGAEHLIPLAGGPWKRGEDIDFDTLPEKFVLKANHGSGMNLVIKDKFTLDKGQTIQTCNEWMKQMYGWLGMEAQYFHIPRCIIAEEYMEQTDGNLLDYKIYCFNGRPIYFAVIGDRNLETHDGRIAFYDMQWVLQDFTTGDYPDYDRELKKPEQMRKLVEIAEILSSGFEYVRVDLYVINGRVYFGEMTFTPGNGFFSWKPKEADRKMGHFFSFPSKTQR